MALVLANYNTFVSSIAGFQSQVGQIKWLKLDHYIVYTNERILVEIHSNAFMCTCL